MTDNKHEHGGCGCGENGGGCGQGHEHGHDHEGCGCHGHEHGEYETIKLSLEDGREVVAAVLEVFELEGKEYIALLPEDEENVLLYELKEDEEGVELINIESDEEFDAVSKTFLELMPFDEEDEE